MRRMPHGPVAFHAGRLSCKKYFLVLHVKFLSLPLHRFCMAFKTVVIRIGFSHLDGQVIGVCVVFVYVDREFRVCSGWMAVCPGWHATISR